MQDEENNGRLEAVRSRLAGGIYADSCAVHGSVQGFFIWLHGLYHRGAVCRSDGEGEADELCVRHV
ncbi:hypothetical protein D3C81_2336720 [compost metagenome]